MLRKSFIHLPGIGPATEKRFWKQGIRTWDDLRAQAPNERIQRGLELSEEAWDRQDLHFFYQALPRDQLWRMLPGYEREVAYLDIETTGLGFPPASESTTVTFYYKGKVYQEHDARKKKALIRDMTDVPLWASFFGEVFDVPFLRAETGLPLEQAHIDLCFWLKRLGFGGGLKRVQKQFKEIPLRDSMDIDGFDAVRLWNLHLEGIQGALETLLHYNAEDTVVLEPLLVKAFNLEAQKNPELGLSELSWPAMPGLKTKIHPEVYARLRGRSE